MRIDDLKKAVSQMTNGELEAGVLKIREDRRNYGRRKKADKADKLLLDVDALENIIAKYDKGKEDGEY